MPAAKRGKTKSGANNKQTRKTKTKNKKNKTKKNANSTIAKIAEIAEEKNNESDAEMSDDHFKPEYYLTKNKKISDNLFTAIDCLAQHQLVPLKEKAMQNPTNKQLKQDTLNRQIKEESLGKKWFIELKLGFNLLCYGVGSKKSVLDDFAMNILWKDPKGRLMIINGYFDDINIREILSNLCSLIIDNDKIRKQTKIKNNIKSNADPRQHSLNIVNYLNENISSIKYKSYYVVIHNIDGKVFRKNKIIQSIFSILANCKYIHLCASIDHIHSLLLWDRLLLSSFHWIYHEITTYNHYYKEMQFEKDETIKISNKGKNTGIKHIMKSLTPGHQDVIRILAESQIENENTGLSQESWFELCFQAMLVSNQLKFDQYITEFLDHAIVIKTNKNGDAIYQIPYDQQIIQAQLIDYIPDE